MRAARWRNCGRAAWFVSAGLVIVGFSEPATAQPDASPAVPLTADSSGLRASLALTDPDGAPLERAPVGAPFRLSLRFTDPLGAPATALTPAAWLRRPGPGRPICQEAARAFRVTGRISADDVRLAGLFVLTVDGEARLGVVDPARATASGNIAALSPLGEAPGAVAVHEGLGAAFATRPIRGDLLRVGLPAGRPVVVAEGLGHPVALLPRPDGRLWVGDDAGGRALLLTGDGRLLATVDLGAGPVRLIPAGPARLVAVGADGAAQILDGATGRLIAAFPAGTATGAATATADALIAIEPDGRLMRRWADAPDAAAEVLGAQGDVGAMAVGTDGRWLVVATTRADSGSGVSVFDLTRGRRVHGFAAPEPVDEAVVAGHAVFLTWQSRPVVTVVDLAALAAGGVGGGDAAVRDVRLVEDPAAGPAMRSGPMLTALHPLPAVALVRPGSRSMATVMAGGGLSSAPMSVVPLKGDPPNRIAAFTRSLVETAPGLFEVSAELPRGGTWELVATTGIGGATACLPIPAVPDDAAATPRSGLRVRFEAATGERSAAHVGNLLVYIDDAPPSAASVRLVLAALDGGWARVVEAEVGNDGVYRVHVAWPWSGAFSIAVAGPPDGAAPAVVRIAP